MVADDGMPLLRLPSNGVSLLLAEEEEDEATFF